MDLFDLVATLSLDKSDYEQGLSDAENQADGFGGKLGTAAKGAMAIGAAGATAVTAIGAAVAKGTSDVASYGDTIDKQSQKMGISAQAYQEWDQILQHNGASISSLQRGMTTLSKAAENGDDSFAKLGITQQELATMNKEELFERTIKGLQGMEDGTERTVLAQKLLGGGAKELGPLLNMSAEETEQLRQRTHELGGVMSDEAVKAAAQYEDSLQDMKFAIDGVKRNVLGSFMPAMSGVFDGIAEIFSGDSNKGLGMVKNGISSFISKLTELIPKVIETGTKIVLALVNALVENLPEIVSAGVQAIGSLVQGIGEALPELIPAIVEAVMTMVETMIDNIDLLIDAALQLMMGLAEGLINAIPVIIEKIPIIIEKLITALVSAIPKIAEAGVQLLVALVQNLPAIIMGIVKAIPQIIAAIVKAFAEGLPKIAEAGKNIITSLGNAIGNGVSTVKEKAGAVWNGIKDTFKNSTENMKTIGSNIGNGLRNGIANTIANVSEIGRKVFDAVKNVFKNAKDAFATIGRNLMVGMYNGIVEKAQAVIDKVKGVADQMLGFAKRILGISSPSKEFAKIGDYMMQGMAQGIESGLTDVDSAMGDMEDVIYKRKPSINVVKNASAYGSMDGSGQYFTVPRQQQARQLTVILELDRMMLGRAVYNLNNEETQRVGVKLAGGYA